MENELSISKSKQFDQVLSKEISSETPKLSIYGYKKNKNNSIGIIEISINQAFKEKDQQIIEKFLLEYSFYISGKVFYVIDYLTEHDISMIKAINKLKSKSAKLIVIHNLKNIWNSNDYTNYL